MTLTYHRIVQHTIQNLQLYAMTGLILRLFPRFVMACPFLLALRLLLADGLIGFFQTFRGIIYTVQSMIHALDRSENGDE